jgi:hypothetical protein
MPDTMMIAVDRKTIELEFSGKLTLTAGQLENFMRDLALWRAQMLPKMPDEELTDKSVYSVVPSQRWSVTLDQDAPTQIRLYLQHLGFGWVWLPLSQSGADQLHEAMQKTLQSRPKIS